MKKIILCLLSAVFCARANAAEYNAVLVADINSGDIIYEDQADKQIYPASLTKLMTLYLTFNALENGKVNLNDTLIVSSKAAGARPVKLGIPAGSKILVEDAIKAVAVYSANDMAVVLSENLTHNNEGNFTEIMNQAAKEIGLKNTNFSNASGLSDEEHISTAKDIALLAIAVRKHYPQYWHYFSIPYFNYNGQPFRNGNGLLGNYAGCDGMKTGYTSKSKYSLVATANQNGRHLVAVVLGANSKGDREGIAKNLLDLGFGKTKKFTLEKTYYESPTEKPEPVEIKEPAREKPQPASQADTGGSGAGVQFGAFSTEAAAEKQADRVRSAMGVNARAEKHDGLWKVRARMGESQAQKIKSQCAGAGIDCFVFH